jgi:hypothetical protein
LLLATTYPQRIADQLRYPSAHTFFFISFLLFLFGASSHAEVPNAIPVTPRCYLPRLTLSVKSKRKARQDGDFGGLGVEFDTLLHAAVFYLGTTSIARFAAQRGIVEFDPKAPEVAILTSSTRSR